MAYDLNARADRIAAAAQRLRNLEHEAAGTIAAANAAANKIIADAIKRADTITADAEHFRLEARANADHMLRQSKLTAERDYARIKERAYLEGRVQADAERVAFDERQAATARRANLRIAA